jgi:hypothetical protein
VPRSAGYRFASEQHRGYTWFGSAPRRWNSSNSIASGASFEQCESGGFVAKEQSRSAHLLVVHGERLELDDRRVRFGGRSSGLQLPEVRSSGASQRPPAACRFSLHRESGG